MPLGFPPLRIGLVASARHRKIPDGALLRLLAPLERTIREEPSCTFSDRPLTR